MWHKPQHLSVGEVEVVAASSIGGVDALSVDGGMTSAIWGFRTEVGATAVRNRLAVLRTGDSRLGTLNLPLLPSRFCETHVA